MSPYWTYRTAAFLSRLVPLKFAYWFGLRVADRFYTTRDADRQAVIANLRQIYAGCGIVPAEATLDGMARKTFQAFGKYLVDFFRFSTLNAAQIMPLISFQGRENLEQAYRMGRGALMVTAHIGNWELGGAVLAMAGYPVNAVVLAERSEKLNRLFRMQRERRGMRVIYVGGDTAGEIGNCLKRGELVAILGDRDFSARRDFIPFFGRPARLPRGPATLAKRYHVPILPGFLFREIDDSFLLRIHPPILPEQAGSIDAMQAQWRDVLQGEIAQRPYQWFLFDEFWANQPPARIGENRS